LLSFAPGSTFLSHGVEFRVRQGRRLILVKVEPAAHAVEQGNEPAGLAMGLLLPQRLNG